MRPVPFLLLPIMMISLSGCSGAEEHSVDCSSAMTTQDINGCAAAQRDEAEARLNDTYQQVMQRLSQAPADPQAGASVAEQLRTAQRLWINFREADCAAKTALYATGSMRTVVYLGCIQSHAKQRTWELESYFPD